MYAISVMETCARYALTLIIADKRNLNVYQD